MNVTRFKESGPFWWQQATLYSAGCNLVGCLCFFDVRLCKPLLRSLPFLIVAETRNISGYSAMGMFSISSFWELLKKPGSSLSVPILKLHRLCAVLSSTKVFFNVLLNFQNSNHFWVVKNSASRIISPV